MSKVYKYLPLISTSIIQPRVPKKAHLDISENLQKVLQNIGDYPTNSKINLRL